MTIIHTNIKLENDKDKKYHLYGYNLIKYKDKIDKQLNKNAQEIEKILKEQI